MFLCIGMAHAFSHAMEVTNFMAPKKEFQDKAKELGGKAKDTVKSVGKKLGGFGSKIKGFFALDEKETGDSVSGAQKKSEKPPVVKTRPVRPASKPEVKQAADREKTQSINILSVPDDKKAKKQKPPQPKQSAEKPLQPSSEQPDKKPQQPKQPKQSAKKPLQPAQPGQPVKKTAQPKQPTEKPKRKPLQQPPVKKAAEAPSEETVVFTDDMTRQFSPDKVKKPLPLQGKKPTPKKELTQPVPVAGKRSIFKPREKKPNFALGVILTTIKMSFVAIVVAVAIVFGSVMGVANAYLGTTPELDVSKIENQSENTKIYDSNQVELATYTGLENREWANLEEIPTDLQNAVIAVEDIRFYDHNGVDFRRLLGAFVSNLSSSKTEGGSTITQQLVKNELLTNERSYKRKLQEAYLATELEKAYSKDEILEAYLNAIPLGGTVYGVKAAAKDYFGKELSQLNLREMICIAAITQNPTKYSPRRATYTKPENLPGLINRMNIIAERMYWNGKLTKEQYEGVVTPAEQYLAPSCLEQDSSGAWKLKEGADMVLRDGYLDTWKAEMNILEESPANSMYPYPHFIEYMIYDVQNFMMDKEGLEHTKANRQKVDKELRSGGYQIYATIDPNIQQTVQDTLATWDDYPDMEDKMETNSAGETIGIPQPQAAAVVIENSSGQLKAIIGSREAPDQMLTFNRAYEGKKQIGSSIKPLSVYGPAFELGYGITSYVPNIDMPIHGWLDKNGEDSSPSHTYGDEPVTIKDAIVHSMNVAAAQTITNYVGIDNSVNYLYKLGVSEESLVDPETGYSTKTGSGLAMGGSNITPIEMAGGYATIARGGEYKQPVSFTKVLDSDGNVVIDTETDREVHEAFTPATCYMLTEALEEAVVSGTGSRARLDGMTTAGKTGTNADNYGVYFAGYTPYYTSTLWVGNDINNISMGSSASRISAPLWKAYMQKIHENLEDKEIAAASGTDEDYGIIDVTVCKYSNKRVSSSACEAVTARMPANSPLLNEECDVCQYSTSESIKMCGVSHMRFVEGKCPEEFAYSYPVSYRTFAEGSPYYGWRSGGGVSATLNEDGSVAEDPTQYCTDPHLPVATPTPALPGTPSTLPPTTPDPGPTDEPTEPVPEPPVVPEGE